MTWVYGIHAVETLLKVAPERIREIRLSKDRSDVRFKNIEQMAGRQGVSFQYSSKKFLDEKVDGRHQGVIANCIELSPKNEQFIYSLFKNRGEKSFFVMLDGVTDPYNLGACLRTAECAGVDALIVPRDRAVGLTPTVRKVSCGAAETVPLVMVTNVARTLLKLKQEGIWVVGASEDAAASIFNQDLTGPLLVVMGSEGKGLRELTRKSCDFFVQIPTFGEISSLNVSVATGIALFEVVRQRNFSCPN
ncbi:MAG: 23S rRNA (guanosine(2251)-2'-O)-methyltransferase RlmB [Cellvibrionales bacterium TMED49]|nr:23S rRNA (guanosine(2251)-2'-O)-methyltransferase RlmB [Porticoccaceae bacterium]OUU39589.1 MAG: 23S rRNA (guanosine(2251)-2'-O)-methyltransferase RlmB [Cellvibrionales bacterium TMED49]